MTPRYDYTILHEEKLVFVLIEGQFIYKKLLKLIDDVLSDPDFNMNYNQLIDLRKIHISPDYDRIERIIEKIYRDYNYAGMRTNLFLTKSPRQNVIPYLFKMQDEGLSMNIEAASSVKAASRHLNVPMSIVRSLLNSMCTARLVKHN